MVQRRLDDLDVFGKDELLKPFDQVILDPAVDIEQEMVTDPEDVHVRHDPALRCQIHRVAPLAIFERRDIVGELPLEIVAPICAPDRDQGAVGAFYEGCRLSQTPIGMAILAHLV